MVLRTRARGSLGTHVFALLHMDGFAVGVASKKQARERAASLALVLNVVNLLWTVGLTRMPVL